jgi:protein MAK16
MIVDEVIWEIINNGQCSFKSKLETNTFCRNEYNVTGLCNRNSCPLANSRYATISEEKGACYLHIKTVERAHTPKDLWEKIKLDKSYNKALEQIDELLMYFPEFLKHKCKQRFTRFRQVLVKRRKLRLQDNGVYEVVSRKATKREKSRGVKALKSAMTENHVEQELLNRLKEGKYDEIMNIDRKLFEKVLNEDENVVNDEEESYDEELFDNIFVGDLNEDIEDYELNKTQENTSIGNNKSDDIESDDKMLNKKRKKKKIHLEYVDDFDSKEKLELFN